MASPAPAWLRPLVDYGPLAAFFIVYWLRDLTAATAAIMIATAIALGLSLAVERRIPPMPLVTAAIVGVFGGLTLWLQDETFIKMKPTIVQLIFAAVLFGGLDHRAADAVLDRTTGIHDLGLTEDGAAGLFRGPAQADQRRVADGVEQVVANVHGPGSGR